MKNKIKELYELYKELPEIILCIVNFIKIPFQETDVKYTKSNNDRINILGNGPSGVETYLKNRITKEKLMCLNYFALNKNFYIFKPEHYIIIDPVYFLDLNEKNLELINVLNTVNWIMRLYIPFKYKKLYNKHIINKNIKIHCIRFNYLPGRNNLVHFLYSKNFANPKFQNVVIAAIYSSLNKGFSQINLHGVEASEFKNFIVNEQNEVLLKTEHFYGTSCINMYEKGRIKKGEFWKFLINYSLMLKGFSQVECYSKYINANIYNYTCNSYIDVFEKKEKNV